MIKVFVVDDHFMIIEGIRSLLQSENGIDWTGHATNAASCLSVLQQRLPDVILMDINLPGTSGIELCREIKDRYPSVCVIGLSTFNQQSFIQKMLGSGASGYVLKNASRTELCEAIETVMKGKIYLPFEVAKTLHSSQPAEAPVLTRREKEILELIAEGMTNNEMAEKLFISPTTIDTHRKNLLSKFNARNTATLIRMAVQMKLV